MSNHKCDTCGRSYRYKRNLTRHMKEKHAEYEHWNCVEVNCSKTFIRRNTLSHHLFTIHGYTPLRAREFALRAPRGDIRVGGYYEDISDDDSVFDIINDIDKIRNVRDANELQQSIMDFDLDYYQDDITLGNECEGKDDSVADVMADNNVEIATVNDDEGRKNSVIMDDDVNSNGPIVDDQIENSELMTNDEASMNNGVVDSVDEAKNEMMAAGEADKYSESDSNNGREISDASVSDSEDGFETGDDWKCDYSENNVSDGNGLNDGDSDGDTDDDDDDDTILISSGDEGAVELSQLQTKTQTFVLTFRRKSQYLNGQEVSTIVSMEKNYYEHDN